MPTKNSLYYSQGISQKCTSPTTKPVPSGRVVISCSLSILSCLPVGMWKEGWFKTWYKNNSDAKMFFLYIFYKLGFSALSWRHSCWENHAVFLYPLWWWKPNKGAKDTETYECSNHMLLYVYESAKEVSTYCCAENIPTATVHSAEQHQSWREGINCGRWWPLWQPWSFSQVRNLLPYGCQAKQNPRFSIGTGLY